jgi:hypothetical protein
MSYAAEQLAGKLKGAKPSAQFNILSAVLPVFTYVKAFKTNPAADVINKILGIPLATVADEFEEHARIRTPVITGWWGAEGNAGRDVFGCCKLLRLGSAVPSWSISGGPTQVGGVDKSWFGIPARRLSDGGPGWYGHNDYTRYSRDGVTIACGYARFGQVPFVSLTAPEGDIQNSNIGGFNEDLYQSSPWGVQVPRLSVIASDGTHTCGPNTTGFVQTALATIPAGSVQTRTWSAYSMSGFAADATHTGLVKVANINAPFTAGPTLGSIAAFGPNAGKGQKVIYFGPKVYLYGAGLDSGAYKHMEWVGPQSLGLTLKEMGGFYYGRRALSAADMQKLYYCGSGTSTNWLQPQQNPTRAMGYLDSMSFNQVAKLLDGIAAGTVDPQTDSPSAVWDAVR